MGRSTARRATAGLLDLDPSSPWTDHYLKRRYKRLDPVIAQSHGCNEPFHWGLESGELLLSAAQKQFFDVASVFGINCGFTNGRTAVCDGSGSHFIPGSFSRRD